VALLWTRATKGAHPGIARNVVIAIVALGLGVLFLDSTASTFVAPGGRILGALLLGYAVLRGQIEGLDLKVRFALSKSTIAAVFIAVFFIASEAAQQFFGDTLGSTYVGIGVAGTLVFAMAPLQRAAEKLAAKAVPVSMESTAAPARPDDREDAYRRAVRLALRGGISRVEDHDLAVLADQLHVGARRALEIREELEQGAAA
jgi:hypothetical protein